MSETSPAPGLSEEEMQAARSLLGTDGPRIIGPNQTAHQAIAAEAAINQDLVEGWYQVLRRNRKEFKLLAEQLKEPIENQKWDSVIGDDISGHWVAVFVHHLMKRYAQENDLDTPTITFVAPKSKIQYLDFKEKRLRRKRERAMSKMLKRRQERLGKSTLIVTEYIAGGLHLDRITKALPGRLHYDIASLAILDSVEGAGSKPYRPYINTGKSSRVFFGASGLIGADSFYSTALTHTAGREKNNELPVAVRSPAFRPKVVQGIRNLTLELADEIYQEVFHPDQGKIAT